MKTSRLHFVFLSVVLTLAAGCQSTTKTTGETWRRPGHFGAPKKSVAVAVLAYRSEMRAEYENALVAALRARGVEAKATYTFLSTETIVNRKDQAVAQVKSLGTEGVLAVRLADKATLDIYHVDPSNSGATLRPWQGWFDFFGVTSAFATRPASLQPGNIIGVSAAFFESPSGTLLWSGNITPTVGDPQTKPAAFARAVVQSLQGAVLIP